MLVSFIGAGALPGVILRMESIRPPSMVTLDGVSKAHAVASVLGDVTGLKEATDAEDA